MSSSSQPTWSRKPTQINWLPLTPWGPASRKKWFRISCRRAVSIQLPAISSQLTLTNSRLKSLTLRSNGISRALPSASRMGMPWWQFTSLKSFRRCRKNSQNRLADPSSPTTGTCSIPLSSISLTRWKRRSSSASTRLRPGSLASTSYRIAPSRISKSPFSSCETSTWSRMAGSLSTSRSTPPKSWSRRSPRKSTMSWRGSRMSTLVTSNGSTSLRRYWSLHITSLLSLRLSRMPPSNSTRTAQFKLSMTSTQSSAAITSLTPSRSLKGANKPAYPGCSAVSPWSSPTLVIGQGGRRWEGRRETSSISGMRTWAINSQRRGLKKSRTWLLHFWQESSWREVASRRLQAKSSRNAFKT